MRRYTVPLSLCLALVVLAVALYAGPLDPPAGPVASTYKTLSEVEPRIAINATNTPGDADSLFKITQPGSYYLTGNITGAAGRIGIEIAAPAAGAGVTIDLMGFEMAGVPGSLEGILVTVAGSRNTAVRNGTVRAWGADGIDLGVSENNLVSSVRLHANAATGLLAGRVTTVTDCTAQANATDGFSLGFGATVHACSARENLGRGIFAGGGSNVSACTVTANTGDGIHVATGSITACAAESSGGAGLRIGQSGFVTGCFSRINTGDGILTGFSSTVTNCTSEQNSGDGIEVGAASTVSGCTANDSTGDGIRVSSSCRVAGNNCVSNGVGPAIAAGIHATGSDNRIEGNNALSNDRGIDVDGAGNIIIRNTCSNNTTANWDAVAGNTILVVLGSAAPAVLGNAGGLAPGSTDPNANFSY